MPIIETFNALKMSADALKSAINLHQQVEIDLKIAELFQKIDGFYSTILELYEKNTQLIQEKADLEKKLMSYEQWEKEKAKYKLHEIDTQVFVYEYQVSKKNTDPMHYCCAKCMHDDKKSILNFNSELSDGSKHYYCPSCGKTTSTHAKRKISITPPPHYGKDSWMQ
jgi:regulator of replication initiation timing